MSRVHTHCGDLLTAVGPGHLDGREVAAKREDLLDAELTTVIQTPLRWGADGAYYSNYARLCSGRRKVMISAREILP